MIKSVHATGFRTLGGTYPLASRTLIVGRNGAGKSSLIHAYQLALLGYLPGLKATAAELFANCANGTEMMVGATVDAGGKQVDVSRRWNKKRDSITNTIQINGTEASGRSADGMLKLALGDEHPVVDVSVVRAMPQKDRRKLILTALGVDLDKPMTDEADARAVINQATANREAATKTAQRLMAELTELPEMVGSVPQLMEKLAKLQVERDQLVKEIAQGDAADRERTEIEAARQRIATRTATVNDLRQKAKDISSRINTLADAVKTQSAALTEAEKYSLPDEFRIKLSKWVASLEAYLKPKVASVEKADEDLSYTLLDMANLLSSSGANLKELRQKLASTMSDLNNAKTEMAGVTTKGKAEVEALHRDEEIAKRDAAPGATPIDHARLDGIDRAIESVNAAMAPANRRQAITDEVERSRIEADKQQQIEDAAKTKLAAAIQAMKDAVAGAHAKLYEKMGFMLPSGNVVLVDEGQRFTLAWVRDDVAVPWETLSGGERVIFDAAIGYLLGGQKATIMLDAGEVDMDNLRNLMASLPGPDQIEQILIAHHTTPSLLDKPWTLVKMG